MTHAYFYLRVRLVVIVCVIAALTCAVFFAASGFSFAAEPSSEPLSVAATKEIVSVEPAPPMVDYNNDIRPILSNNCYACHGPDQAMQAKTGGLRLDTFEGATANAKSGRFPIVPGKPDESELVRRIFSENPGELMPPPDSTHSLTEEQKQTLRQWIAEGAQYRTHWAFVAPVRPPLPHVKNADWPENAIDHFILARLEKEGLAPSPEADRHTLIRRVTFDLTGLPPTPQEVEAFVQDSSADAYEKLVDRLLASTAYGEHKGRYWLDAVRYADTHGLHFDNYREMWLYRDWVINALNNNMPFDQFATEQLAGDLLPEPTTSQLIASGYNRNNLTTNEGGSILEEVYVRNVVDRVDTTGTVFMGMTLGCAQCHDHKFDPLTQKEFFELFAFFNNLEGFERDGNIRYAAPFIRVPTNKQQAELDQYRNRMDEIEDQIAQLTREYEAGFVRWLKNQQMVPVSAEIIAVDAAGETTGDASEAITSAASPEQPAVDLNRGLYAHYPLDGPLQASESETEEKHVLVPNIADDTKPGKVVSEAQWVTGRINGGFRFSEGSYINLEKTGPADSRKPFSFGAWIKTPGDIEGTIISRTLGGEGYYGYLLHVDRTKLTVNLNREYPGYFAQINTPDGVLQPDRWHHVFVTYQGGNRAEHLRIYVDGKLQERIIISDSYDKSGKQLFLERANVHLGRRYKSHPFTGGIMDDVRFYKRELPAHEVASLARLPLITEILAKDSAHHSSEELAILRAQYFESVHPKTVELYNELHKLQLKVRELLFRTPTTLVFRESEQVRPAYVLDRGEYDKKKEQVERGTPAFLPPMPEDFPQNRLGLARWLLDAEHPLTSRVTVNRYWQQYFGRGIVETSEDFGVQAARPTHPQLLDWLAVEFRESGWDMKQLHKLIVMSATYRQSAKVAPELAHRDPQNLLLARGPRFRLDAEMLRDQALAVSGLLVDKVGGPSVKPPQPAGLWEAVGYPDADTTKFKADEGEKIYRRSLYTFWKRTSPPPMLSILDAPSREACTVRRERTNTPLQALLMMNEEQYVESARHLAYEMIRMHETDESLLAGMFEKTVCRPMLPSEKQVLVSAYEDYLSHYQANPEAARELIAGGQRKIDDAGDPARLAAWTMIANTILNLDEVITKG